MQDMEHPLKKILFIAYLYPPAGGKALPGVQRTVKFVRNLKGFRKYVLALNADAYPDFFTRNNQTTLPVADEILIRTRAIDIFELLIFIRAKIRRLFKHPQFQASNLMSNKLEITATAEEASGRKNDFFVRFKDFVSYVLTFPDYAYGWCIPAILRGRKLIKEEKIDVIFATGMPWSSLVVGLILRLTTNAKLIVDFRDPWVGNPFAVNKGNLIKRFEKYIERKIIEKADKVTLNTESLQEDFQQRYSFLDGRKFTTLPNGFDSTDFPAHLTKVSGIPNSSSKQLIVTHCGFLYGLRSPEPLLKSLAYLKKAQPDLVKDIRIKQIGDTEIEFKWEEFLKENDLTDNYTDIGPLPYTQCLEEMSNSDILLIIQQDTATQVPSKLYEYIYLNKPILAISRRNGALGKLIKKNDFGHVFEEDEIEKIAEYLSQKINEKRAKKCLNTEYIHKNSFDIKNISNKLSVMIHNL